MNQKTKVGTDQQVTGRTAKAIHYYVTSGSRIMAHMSSSPQAFKTAEKLIASGATKIVIFQPGNHDIAIFTWNDQREYVSFQKMFVPDFSKRPLGERKALHKAIEIEKRRRAG